MTGPESYEGLSDSPLKQRINRLMSDQSFADAVSERVALFEGQLKGVLSEGFPDVPDVIEMVRCIPEFHPLIGSTFHSADREVPPEVEQTIEYHIGLFLDEIEKDLD